MPKIFVISLGGSLIFPKELDRKFLADFKKAILKHAKKGCRFVVVCGGGRLARSFQEVASKAKKLSNRELDWLGIYATKINAHLLKSVFGGNADEDIISNPKLKIKSKKNVVIASGWLPGWSTDYDAVLLAKNAGVKEVINMSNVDYVYSSNPLKHRDAKKIEKIAWKDYRKMAGSRWKAGMSMPFDPIAAKEAEKSGIRAYVIGRDLKNLGNLLNGRKFKGTIIE